MPAVEHLVVKFETESARYSACVIPLSEVREILPLQQIYFVPGCRHPSVQGLSMVRGEPALVVDLGLFLEMQGAHDIPSAVIVISDLDRCVQAFVVRKVVGIEKLDETQVQNVGLNDCRVATLSDGSLAAILSLQAVLDRLGQPDAPELLER